MTQLPALLLGEVIGGLVVGLILLGCGVWRPR